MATVQTFPLEPKLPLASFKTFFLLALDATALTDLLDDIVVPQKELVLEALSLFSVTKLDYVDCIYIAESKARNERVLTFDRKMISKMKQLGIPE